MSDKQPMTLDQIRQAGIRPLIRELGPAGMIRFMQQFELGSGDYTQERHQWLDAENVQTIVERIEQRRNTQS
jgi:hypothetical protein